MNNSISVSIMTVCHECNFKTAFHNVFCPKCKTRLQWNRHDEKYEYRECNKCCADEPMVAQRCDVYEDKATCIECSLKSGTQLEEISGLFATY